MAKAFSNRFYHSKKWKEIRAFVLTRDFYLCQVCKIPNCNTVHHIKELTPMNIDDPNISVNPSNLITVCKRCHDLIHDRYKQSEDTQRYTFDEEGNVIPCDAQAATLSSTHELTDEQQTLIKMYQTQLH